MEFIEHVDQRKLAYLKSLPRAEIYKLYPKCKTKLDREKQFTMLNNYLDRMIKVRGEMKHIYKYTLSTNWAMGGRLFSGTSVQGISGIVRGFLFNHTTDYDMSNAHPKILLYLCKKHNLPKDKYVYLSHYCENRDEVLDSEGNRNEMKTNILKVVNNDKVNRGLQGIVKDLDKECKGLQKIITQLPEYADLVLTVPQHKLYNWYGSAINRILCKYENEFLQDIIHVLNRNGQEVTVLAFDGCMSVGETFLEDEIAAYMNEKHEHLDMVITRKAHDGTIVMPEDFVQPPPHKTAEELEKEMKENKHLTFTEVSTEFEKHHLKIINKSVYIKETETEVLFKTEGDLRSSYKHMTFYEMKVGVTGEVYEVESNFINKWITNNPGIRRKTDVGVYPPPMTCPADRYNIWRPFDMETVDEWVDKPAERDEFLNLIKVLCGNETEVYDYFISWIGQMVQYPAEKSICPTLISLAGAGKGTMMHLIRRMLGMGKVMEVSTPSRDVWGNFNSKMASSFLINLNEIGKKETMESEGKIKALITDSALTINPKGSDQYDIVSYHRFIITTNKEEPISTSKDDRRNLIIQSSNEMKGNAPYFTRMYEHLDDPNVIKTCYEYFKQLPNLHRFKELKIPLTDYHKELQSFSTSPIELHIQRQVEKNFDYLNEWGLPVMEVKCKDLFQSFLRFKESRQIQYDCSQVKYLVRLKRLGLDGVSKGRHTRDGNTTYFDLAKLKKTFDIEMVVDE